MIRSSLKLGSLIACVASVSFARADAVPLDGSERAKPVGNCVAVRTEAIYSGYGYNHVVRLSNTCGKPMRCEVRTAATPEPVRVDLAKDEEKELTTFRGSPASEVSASVKCEPSPS